MRVAVFTGSAEGSAAHHQAATDLAEGLVGAGVGIVYGGGRVGLMGAVADAALERGGEVVGVMPRHLIDREIAHEGLTRLDVVDTMHERKARMAELADAFVALPGGVGTFEELFEAWTWGQLGLHRKPVALLDPDGFYAPLLLQLDIMESTGYLSTAHRQSLGVVVDCESLLAWISSYEPPTPKWTSTSASVETAETNLTSVGWVHVEDGRLLAVRTHGRDRFYLPGGKPEAGEDLVSALTREVAEELGVTLHNVRPVFTIRAPAHGASEPTTLIMHCFEAEPTGAFTAAHEIDELGWMDMPTDPRAAPAVEMVLARLAPLQ